MFRGKRKSMKIYKQKSLARVLSKNQNAKRNGMLVYNQDTIGKRNLKRAYSERQ